MATTPNFLENFALSRSFALGKNFSLVAKKEISHLTPSPILRASESLATALLQTLGVILLFVLLLQLLAPWPSRPSFQNHTWKKTFPSSTSHLEKTTCYYDAASGSSLYCNGDPVNGLDPDGRCVEKGKQEFAEGYDKSYYANGADVQYDNGIQQVGGFVGNSVLKAQPVIGTDPGTIAAGLQFNVAAGLQFNISVQGSISNWADPATRRVGTIFSITPLTGVSTAIGISGGVLTTKSSVNAPEKLNGWGGNGGGSITTAPFVNGYDEGNWGSKPMHSLFNGIGWSPSFGIPVLPVEAHTSATWTTSKSWNF